MVKVGVCPICSEVHNVGFVATRLAGTDGVSLETFKWANIFEAQGLSCFYFAGELDRPAERCHLVPEAHFTHPDIKDVYQESFDHNGRERAVSKKIYQLAIKLKDHLYEFVEKFNIQLIIPENALTIPLNIPLGIALTEFIAETNIQTIAHHHDFYWERDRFMINAVQDYLNMAFPPVLPSIHHVVINSVADAQLSLRTGVSARITPNVMDFENPPPPPDEYTLDVRRALGIEDDELFILQPTRVVQRKGIEHAIEMVHRMRRKAKLIISHASGDEGHDRRRGAVHAAVRAGPVRHARAVHRVPADFDRCRPCDSQEADGLGWTRWADSGKLGPVQHRRITVGWFVVAKGVLRGRFDSQGQRWGGESAANRAVVGRSRCGIAHPG